MSERMLYHALLRPAIIQILRAQGFSGTKPSVIDTVTDLAANYLMLLATRALVHAHTNHIEPKLDITDVRMAMVDCGILQPSTTASQEVWRELLRKPVEEIPDRGRLHQAVISERDEQDTEDVTAFVNFFRSNAYKEIIRVAGVLPEEDITGEVEKRKPQSYLVALKKKKHSKTGEGSRFQGTVLGKRGEMRAVRIDGTSGQPESIGEWQDRVKQISRKLASTRQANEDVIRSVEMEDAG